MTESILEKNIDEIAGRYVSDVTPGFSMLIARDKDIIFRKAYGMADLERGIPNEPSGHYIIASNTKQFVCLSILMLREQGLLDLDEPIARFFPDFPDYKDEVTVRMLMCHTSGIMEYFNDDFEKNIPVLRTAHAEDILELAKSYGNKLHFTPDTSQSYCNTAYVMLGCIIQQLTGMKFGEFLKKEIFDILEMDQSVAPDYMDQIDPLQVVGYMSKEGENAELISEAGEEQTSADTQMYEEVFAGSENAAGEDAPRFFRVPYDMLEVGYADGNISTNVDDILKWHRYLYNENDDRIVPYSVRRELWVPHVLKTGEKTNYGLGIMTGDFDDDHHTVSDRRELWHTGGADGFISRISYFPDEKISAVLLTNWNGLKMNDLFFEIMGAFFECM